MNNLTPRAQQALVIARKFAETKNHNYIGVEHLLWGIVTVTPEWKIDLQGMSDFIEASPKGHRNTDLSGEKFSPYTPRVKKILALADKVRKRAASSYIDTNTIMVALLEEGAECNGNPGTDLMDKLGIDWKEEYKILITEGKMEQTKQEQPKSDVLTLANIAGKTIKTVSVIKQRESHTTWYAATTGVGAGESEKEILRLTFTDDTSFDYSPS